MAAAPRTPVGRAGAPPASVFPDAPGEGALVGDKARQVRAMFSGIARRYDLLNTVLSLGVDRRWRAQAARAALAGGAHRVCDVATGTGDLALELERCGAADVLGVDFAEPMLALARRKAARRGARVRFELGDGTALDAPDASFDALTIAYGLRNFESVEAGLQEFARVLKPGGRLVVLEFPPPPGGMFGALFRAYFLRVLPFVGGLVSGNGRAYRYLPASVLAFPRPEALAGLMREAGFERVTWRLQTFGVSALHVGVRSA